MYPPSGFDQIAVTGLASFVLPSPKVVGFCGRIFHIKDEEGGLIGRQLPLGTHSEEFVRGSQLPRTRSWWMEFLWFCRHRNLLSRAIEHSAWKMRKSVRQSSGYYCLCSTGWHFTSKVREVIRICFPTVNSTGGW